MGTVLETLAVDLLGDGPVRSGPVRSEDVLLRFLQHSQAADS